MSDSAWTKKLVDEVNDLKGQRRHLIGIIKDAVELFEDAHKDDAYKLLKGSLPGGFTNDKES